MISGLLQRVDRRWFIAMLVIAAVLSGAGLLAREVDVPVAVISEVSGFVELRRAGSSAWREAGEGVELFPGDELRTGTSAWAELSFDEDAFARLEAESHIVVTGPMLLSDAAVDSGTATLRMQVGRLWVRVVQRIERWVNFSVETPHAVAGVRGTVFYIEVADAEDMTVVGVREGSVAVATARTEVLVESGQAVRVHSIDSASAPAASAHVLTASADWGDAFWTKADRMQTPAGAVGRGPLLGERICGRTHEYEEVECDSYRPGE